MRLLTLRRALVVTLTVFLALVFGAGTSLAADPPPALSAPDPGNVAQPVGANSDLPAQLNAKIEAADQQAAALQQKEDSLKQQVDTHNQAVDSNNQAESTCEQQIATLAQEEQDLETQIDTHNAEPHEFEIPDQEAEANAYQAEADSLNSQKSDLQAQSGQLTAQQENLDSQATQLDTEEGQLSEQIDEANSEAQQLATERQQLLQQVATAMQNLIDNYEQATEQGAQSVAGGDSTSSPGQSLSADSTADDGGDTANPTAAQQAISDYAASHDIDIDMQPVKVYQSPQSVSGLNPSVAARIPLSNDYSGVFRNPDGTYSAVRLTHFGAPETKPDADFDKRINAGGRAIAIVNGQKITITKVVNVASTPAVGAVPQGLTPDKYAQLAQAIRTGIANNVGDNVVDIVVQGSRAAGTARPDSDIDFAVRVTPDAFGQLINKRFGTPNPNSAKEKTMEWAMLSGKIQAGEMGWSGLRKALASQFGMKIDLSVIEVGGEFDNPPFVEVP
jgi:predicted  nucleic acid-binding Zn-ribbon protein